MGSQVKGRRRVKKAVAKFCKENGYTFVGMGSARGNPHHRSKNQKHGKIEIEANGHKIIVGWSGSPKGGWESVCLMVVDHLKRKIRAAEERENGEE